MTRRVRWAVLWVALVALCSSPLFAQERWVYCYDGPGGPGGGSDRANSIAMGPDGNLYAAGVSEGGGNGADITVISLTPSGDAHWVYRWSSGLSDEAFSIAVGSDGNVYAAGHSWGGGYRYYFSVISLTPSGGERWFYRYYGPGDGWDSAYSIAAGTDGNLYAAGESEFLMAPTDFIVISLDTLGTERWVYRYNGPAYDQDQARSIVMGTDWNLYVAGCSMGTLDDFTIISLDASGTERWVYRYNGPADGLDKAFSVVMGTDWNLYAAGYSQGTATGLDFTVISLTPSGGERWVYRYNGPADSTDAAYSITAGPDGNLYAAGCSWGTGTRTDFTVISLDTSGTERWVYRYNGRRDFQDYASSIVAGADGNLYAAGRSIESGTYSDFTVISLDTSGAERWIYSYDGSADRIDGANSIFAGTDGNLYAAGYSSGSGTGLDFAVISLAGDARDVGAASVDQPPDTVACADTVPVSATVCNYGDTLETFDVEAVIDSSNVVVYADTQTVVDLLPDSCISVSFADWRVPPVHGVSYAVRVTTLFTLDISPANDTASKEVVAWCPPGLEESLANEQLSMINDQLLQNYPNPFGEFTIINYQLPKSRHTERERGGGGEESQIPDRTSHITLTVHDVSGRLVRTLVDEPSNHPAIQPSNQVVWDGRDDSGERVGGGVYFCRLTAGFEGSRGAGSVAATEKLILLK